MRITKEWLFRLRGFPSLVIFFACQRMLGVLPAGVLAALYAVGFTLAGLTADRLVKLDYGVVFFWAAFLSLNVAFPNHAEALQYQYFTSLLYLCLFVVAYMPVVFGAEPFTIAFAKRQTPKELWGTPPFQAINRIMTLAWAGLFLVAAAITLLPTIWFKLVTPVLLMVSVGVPFTKKFPGYYLRRLEGKDEAAGMKKQSETSPGKHSRQSPSMPKAPSSVGIDEERRREAQGFAPIKNAVVIFGSPRGKRGYTYESLELMLKGMTDNGVQVDFVNLAEKKIKPCTGCFSCWTKTPGTCIHHDDMPELLAKVNAADLVIYAQPLYTFSVPGITKNFLDRLLPQLEPYLVARKDGSTRHPLRWRKDNRPRMLVFSVCGFPELGHFKPMLNMFRALAANSNSFIVGEILRPASESLFFKERFGGRFQRVADALYEAGREIAGSGFVPRETEERIAAPFHGSLPAAHAVANQLWNCLIAYEELRRQGGNDLDRKEYLREQPALLFAGMASSFEPAKADDFEGVVQFEITDRTSGSYFLEVRDHQCRMGVGRTEQADCTVKTPWPLWRGISEGEISGQDAYLQGRYQVEGDLGVLMKLRQAMKG